MSFFIPTAATGNGLSLATFGRTGEIMGFFYPRIGYAQNVREGMPAIRLLDAPEPTSFHWGFSDCWRVAQSFEPASNALITRLAHREISLNIEISDVMMPGEYGLFRRVIVTKSSEIGPVQFIHYFRLALGDMAPRNGVQAYKQENIVVQHLRDIAIAVTATQPFATQCSTCKPETESPTKQALRSGNLGTSLQAIGRVDFAVGFEPTNEARWQTTIILAGASTRESAMAAAKRLVAIPFEQAIRSANDRVADELSDAGPCPIPELADAFDRAVISLHDLYDQSEGTFIAAPEFDPGYEWSGGYGYCWPRDAAVCALTVQKLGRADMAQRFFEWSTRTQLANGHWYQRYWTDGLPASSWCVLDEEIQLDQTCAIVHAAGLCARKLGSLAKSFVEAYRPTAERATRAIVDHIGDDHLHRKASDLWENSAGKFAYTQAGVISALREADEVFDIDPTRTGPAVRSALRNQLIKTFWRPQRRCWLRRIAPDGKPDTTLDSSAMGIIEPWAVLNLNNAKDRHLAVETLNSISENLRSEVKNGTGILRFEGESYMGGGPGCVNTLWLALCRLRLALTAGNSMEQLKQRELAMNDIRVVLANTNPTGQLPELFPKILFDYWAAPHAWACSLLIEVALALRSLDKDSAMAFDAERARLRRRAPFR